MRKSHRRQSPELCGRAHRYGTRHKRENVPAEIDKAKVEDIRLELALELGLEDTFPASDPVAVVQPGRADHAIE
jgi:hypothetical protein